MVLCPERSEEADLGATAATTAERRPCFEGTDRPIDTRIVVRDPPLIGRFSDLVRIFASRVRGARATEPLRVAGWPRANARPALSGENPLA